MEIKLIIESVALILATAVGGLMRYLGSRYSMKMAVHSDIRQAIIPLVLKNMSQVEFRLFQMLNGKDLDDIEVNEFLAGCYWLPINIRDRGIIAVNHLLTGAKEQAYTDLQQLNKELQEYKQSLIFGRMIK